MVSEPLSFRLKTHELLTAPETLPLEISPGPTPHLHDSLGLSHWKLKNNLLGVALVCSSFLCFCTDGERL